MKYIVNLSLTNEDSIKARMKAFTDLCDRYSKTFLTENCFSLFSHYAINTPWVALKYQQNLSLINEYKIGKLTTKQFLDAMLGIFSFLQNHSVAFFENEDVDRLFANKEHLISLKGISHATDLTGQKIARALIEEAWTSAIRLPDPSHNRLSLLLDKLCPDDSICFISNSNEMDINTILRLLKEHYSEIDWVEYPGISSNPDKDDVTEPLRIANQMSLAVSYQFHSFKTMSDNKGIPLSGTPALLTTLLEPVDKKNTVIISQYPKDLEQAQLLGIPRANCHPAQEFFAPTRPTENQKMR